MLTRHCCDSFAFCGTTVRLGIARYPYFSSRQIIVNETQAHKVLPSKVSAIELPFWTRSRHYVSLRPY
jgi:hypothetical protein